VIAKRKGVTATRGLKDAWVGFVPADGGRA